MLDYEVTTYTTTTVVTTSTQTINSTETQTVTVITTNTVTGTTTQTVNATETTKLSDLGVSTGVVEIYSYENGTQQITITPHETLASLASIIPGATFSDGRLSLDGVKIVNDGGTNLVSALGLTETTTSTANVVESQALYYVSAGASATTPPSGSSAGFLEQITRRDTSGMTGLSVVSETTSISSGTYSISTTEELVQLATMTNNGKIKGGEFVLANDIDLSSIANWTPIGNSSKPFKGIFDGNGYTISNMKINSSDSYVGLFGYVYGYSATIKNVALENFGITATGSRANVGGLVGYASISLTSTSPISNCNVSGNITATGSSVVGGLVGISPTSLSISNCNVSGNITATGSNVVGGLVGDASSNYASLRISNCNIYSAIKTNTTFSDALSGGAVGRSNSITLSNVNIYCPDSSEIKTRFVGLLTESNTCTITKSRYNQSFSTLKDYGKQDSPQYIAIGTTKVTSTPSLPIGLMQSVTRRDTSGMTGLSVVSETTSISSGTYSISTTEELVKFATMVNSGNITGGEIVLGGNIDLSSIDNWTPIGDVYNYFKGTFDGNGHTISNMKINSSDMFVGLFGYIRGDIKNVALENIDITATGSLAEVGGLVGDSSSSSSISNCNVSGNITAMDSSADVGGLLGFSGLSSISNCNVYSTIKANTTSAKAFSGGAVGQFYLRRSTLDNVNIYCPDGSKIKARFVGLADNQITLTITNSSYYSALDSLPDYLGFGYLNSTGTTSSTVTPPTTYEPIGGNPTTTKVVVSAWEDRHSVKVVDLTDADGNSLGITTGTLVINDNGTSSTFTITNDTTLYDLLSTKITQGSNGGLQFTLDDIVSISDGTSNLISKLFGTSQITGQDFATNSSLLQTTQTITGTHTETTTTTTTKTIPITTTKTTTVTTTNTTSSTATYAINGSTRLSDLSDEPLPTNWVLNMKDKNGQDVSRTINIRSTETFDSLMYKLNAIDGITAYMENGNKFTIITDSDKYSSVYMDGAMYDYLGMSALYIGDSTGLQISSKELNYKETHTATSRLSASNYADESVKLSDLNISSGTFTLFNNGSHKVITVNENETLGQLKSRITTAFSDLRFEINDGKISIYSTNKTDVYAGSNIDSSNIASILNFERNEETHGLTSQSPKYMVSEDSVVTKSGLFRSGTVTTGKFKVGGEEINIDSNTTMSDIINQINYSDKAQARAYWDSVNGELVITSKVTGAFYIDIEAGNSNFTDILGFTEKEGGVKKLDTTSQTIGKNAIFSINGTRITSNSNTIKSDISRIEGLTINLKDVTAGETVTINIEKDKETPANAISDVVDAYNELIENVDKEVARGGKLSDQSALKLIRNQLRSLMTSTISTSSVYKNLAAIGIKTEAARGGNISTANIHKLYFDKQKFEDAFLGDSEGIKTLLVGTDDAKGVFMQLEDAVENALTSVSGYFDSAANSYTKKIKRYDDKINKLDLAADRYKARLEKKFQAMDMIISKIQNSYASFLG